MLDRLESQKSLILQQRRELAELFGFETRNKFEILTPEKEVLGFCAEQQKGLLGFLFRQYLGHWRSFEMHFFDSNKQLVMRARHPFRFFFQRLEIFNKEDQKIGSLQQRFGVFTKKFDLEDPQGNVVLEMRSGFLKFWTFPFTKNGREVGAVRKKWSGLFREAFLDSDTFQIEFGPELSSQERALLLAAVVFIDLQYFETKG